MQAKLKIITTLSVLGIVTPFLGVPFSWRMWMSAVLAFVVALIAYISLARNAKASIHEPVTEVVEEAPFVDSHPEYTSEEQ